MSTGARRYPHRVLTPAKCMEPGLSPHSAMVVYKFLREHFRGGRSVAKANVRKAMPQPLSCICLVPTGSRAFRRTAALSAC